MSISSIFKKTAKRISRNFFIPNGGNKIISIKTPETYIGNMLLSYVIDPFLLKNRENVSNSHTHDWESLKIAETFLSLGYDVDVIDYSNFSFKPQKDYSFFVSARTNFQQISSFLNNNCIKIVHLDVAHWIYNNYFAYKRLLSLQKRKKVTLSNPKFIEINWAIENSDYATILGNKFTIDTYRFAEKPIFRVPISTCATYPAPQGKDFNNCRNNFLWFGSSGFVHKGLDLVLDAFAEMPDFHLFVFGPISEEKGFEKAYYRELYHTPNIHTQGWVDVTSDDFINHANKCIALVYPSCSEGGGGSVINCLHAGLIPIVSYESSVDIGNFGIILKESSLEEIKKSVQKIAMLSNNHLREMSISAWKFANANHTRETFALEFMKTIKKIISLHAGEDLHT